MKMLRLRLGLLTLCIAAIGLAGCGSDSGSSGAVPMLRIHLTDAPFPTDRVVSAMVEIESVEIRGASGGFQPLTPFEPQEFDLVKLRNGVTEVLFEGVLEPGDYDALRLICNPLEITVREGEETVTYTEFAVPSGPQTGVKVFVDPVLTLVTQFTEDLLLDMDLSRSFVVQGNPGTPAGIKGFHFQPVVRAVNQSTAGTLTFRVMSDAGTPGDAADDFFLNGVAYDVTDGGTLVASGASGPMPLADGSGFSDDPADRGYVRNPGIPAGDYDLLLTRDGHAGYSDTLTIWIANLTDLGTITLAAEGGSLGGTVTTELTDANGATVVVPLPGAVVSSEAATGPVVSGEDGTYRLEYAVPLEPQTVTATLAGYAEGSVEATPRVAGAEPLSADIALTPLTSDLTVAVRSVADDPDAGVPGVTVELTLLANGGPMGSGITDEDGLALFEALPTADYQVDLSQGATAVGSETYALEGGSPLPLEMVVTPSTP